MEKKNLIKVFGIALLVFLVGAVLTLTFVTVATTGASTKESRINSINAEISRLEVVMLKSLPECEKASVAKENKAKLEGEKVELVHGPFTDREANGFQPDL